MLSCGGWSRSWNYSYKVNFGAVLFNFTRYQNLVCKIRGRKFRNSKSWGVHCEFKKRLELWFIVSTAVTPPRGLREVWKSGVGEGGGSNMMVESVPPDSDRVILSAKSRGASPPGSDGPASMSRPIDYTTAKWQRNVENVTKSVGCQM